MSPLSQAAENFAAIGGLLGLFLGFHPSMSSENDWIIQYGLFISSEFLIPKDIYLVQVLS